MSIATFTFSLAAGEDVTVYATGGAGGSNIGIMVTADVNTPPAAGQSRLRVAQLSPTAGAIDVFVTAPPDSIDPGEGPVRIAWIGGIFGFISGTAFAVLLSVADGRKMLRGLSVWRAALWGALGTAAFPLLTTVDNRMFILVCPLGAALAATWVAVAKKAERGARTDEPVGS